MIRITFNILIGMLCFLLTSCLIDNEKDNEAASGQVDVTFSVALPQPEIVNTRAGLPYSDTDIKTVDVLVFDQHGRFMNRIKVDEFTLASTGSGVKFSIRLDATSDGRTIHLVANGRTTDGLTDRVNFQDMSVGALESDILPSLQTRMTNQGSGLLADIMPLVMWGRTDLNEVSAISSASIKLLRVAASVHVKTVDGTMENGLLEFELKKFALIGAVGGGYLTPANGFYDVVTPTLPRPLTSGPAWGVEQTWSNEDILTLYTYECGYSAPNYQGVVLAATYGGQACFYKVALVTEDGTPLDIVRNHRYTLAVTKVSGPGYTDINTAINSAPSNAIKVSLIDENEDFPCIVADGQYMMGLSNNSLVVYGNNTNRLVLATVYSSRGVLPVPSMPAGEEAWLNNLNAYEIGSNHYEISADFHSVGDQPHFTTLTLTCDNLVQTMQVDLIPTFSSPIALFGADDESWTTRIVSGTISLNPYKPAVGEMVTSLTSKYGLPAYLYVDAGAKGVVKVSTSVNGTAISRRVVIP